MWEVHNTVRWIIILSLSIEKCKPDVLLDCGNDLFCRKIYHRSWDKINNLMMVMQEVDHHPDGLTTLVNPNPQYLVPHGVVLTQPLLAYLPTPPQNGYPKETWPNKGYHFRSQPDQRYVMRYGRPPGPMRRPTEYYVRKPGLQEPGYHLGNQLEGEFKAPKVEIIPSLSYALPSDITTYHPPDFSQNYLMDASTETAPSGMLGRGDTGGGGVPYSSRSYASVQYFHPGSRPEEKDVQEVQETKEVAEAPKGDVEDPAEEATPAEKVTE